jgi:transcriptional regulator with XRE-family HTH domain
MKPSQSFARQIHAFRKGRGWVQQDLIDRLRDLDYDGLSRSALSKMETSPDPSVGLDDALALSAALAIPPIYVAVPLTRHSSVEITPALQVDAGEARLWWRGYGPITDDLHYQNAVPRDHRMLASTLARLHDILEEMGEIREDRTLEDHERDAAEEIVDLIGNDLRRALRRARDRVRELREEG